MAALEHDFRCAVRRMRARPMESSVILLTLTLALGANSAVFSVLHSVLLVPLPYGDPSRLVAVHEVQTNAGLRGQPVAYANLRDWQAAGTAVESLAAARPAALTFTDGAEPERVPGLRVTPGMLGTLGIRPALGRDFVQDEGVAGHDAVALVSHDLWQRRFGGDPDLVGRRVHLDGRPFEVIGVLPAGIRYPGLRIPASGSDVWIPYVATPAEERRGFHTLRVVGRLRTGVSREQAEQELKAVAAALQKPYPDTNTGYSVELVPLHQALTADVAPVLWFLTATVLFLLLLACLNVASVTLAATAARRTEVAIRASLGASRWDVCRQLFAEGAALATIGGAAGLALTYWAVPVLVRISDSAIPRSEEIAMRGDVVLWTAALSLASALLSSGAPALFFHRIPGSASFGIRRGSSEGHASQRLLQTLTAAEIALAVLLLMGTGLMTRSLARVAEVEIGFDPAGVTSASLNLPLRGYPDQVTQARFIERYLDALGTEPGVQAAAVLMRLPLGGYATTTFRPRGQPYASGQEPWADYRTVSERTFEVLRIPVLAGRAFTADDSAAAADVIVVNATLAKRFWPGEDAVGKQLQIGDELTRWRTVVGVVGDVRMASREKDVEPAIYVPYRQNTWSNALAGGYLLIRTSRAGFDPVPAARRALLALDRGTALADTRALEDIVRSSLGRRRFSTLLFTLFGALGYVLAALGVYGVVSSMVSQRTYELAVRAALGAPRPRTFASVVGRGAVLGGTGCAIGLLLAFPLTTRVAGLLYGVTPFDGPTVAGTCLLLMGVSTAACVLPARRAVTVDPLIVMRGNS